MLQAARFLALDDEGLLSSLALDPVGQLSAVADEAREAGLPVVIDEVQRLPRITLALKRIVDHDRRPGQFVLTGSPDIFAMPEAMDSLAGRVSALTLYPLSAAEIQRGDPCRLLDAVGENPSALAGAFPMPLPDSRGHAIERIVRGGFPEIRPLNGTDRMERYTAYLFSVIERDVAPVAEIRRPDTLCRLVINSPSTPRRNSTLAALAQFWVRVVRPSPAMSIFCPGLASSTVSAPGPHQVRGGT